MVKKSTKKSSRKEPTLTDLASAIQDLTEAVQIGFTKNDHQHDEIKDNINDVGYRVTVLEKRTGSLEHAVEDMADTLKGVARAVDKDTVTILDHERRIRHLEKAHTH